MSAKTCFSAVILLVASVAGLGAALATGRPTIPAEGSRSDGTTAADGTVGNGNLSPVSAPDAGVGALGRLEPGWKVLHIAPPVSVEGVVDQLCVDEGDTVHQGDLLATLEIRERRAAALEEAAAQVLVAEAKLALVKAGPEPEDIQALEAEVAQLQASLANAEASFRRAGKLHVAKSLTAEELETRSMDLERAKRLVEKAEAQLAALRTVRPEDIRGAEAELARSRAAHRRAQAELAVCEIRAPLDGRVLKLYARPGEKIGENGFAELGDTADMQAVAEVHERDIARVRVGQSAIVKVQSLSEEFAGKVIHVGWKVGRQVTLDNDPVKDTDARVIEVRIRLDQAAALRVSGLTYARVEIRIDAGEGR